MKKAKGLTRNDEDILGCTFYHNNLSVKIANSNDTLSAISDVDVLFLNDKKQAKRVAKLKKLMAEATKLAKEINADYYAALNERYYQSIEQ